MGKINSYNPCTNELIQSYEEHSFDEVSSILSSSHQSFMKWKQTSFETRGALFLKMVSLLNERKDELGKIISLEMGKPIKESIGEVKKCAWVCEYYAENAQKFLAKEAVEADFKKSEVLYRPIGVILGIMPWNFPFWQVFRFAAPTMMAGNTAVIKHAENVTACALAIEDLFKECGFMEYSYANILVDKSNMEKVVAHKLVAGVSLTGSTRAGKEVGKISGENLKSSVFELGGSDPYIILEDANIDLAVEKCIFSRYLNGGQSCIAAKRFIVVQSRYNEFVDRLKSKISKITYGDPFDEKNQMGPMARVDLRDELDRQVSKSIELGAKALIGGKIEKKEGAFYPPSLLLNVKKGMPAFDEEIFGPVSVVIKAIDESQAIEIANDTSFGLGCAIFSKDEAKAFAIASEKLEAGCCFVNDFVKSDPRLPFGGIKESGVGRELGSFGIKEFINVKTVALAHGEK